VPTYEYICEKCGHHFEMARSISAPPLKICPKELCGQKKWGRGRVKKQISAGTGLLFKGSGFYITDYRSDKYKAAAKKESGENKPAAKTEPAKTETKSAPEKTVSKPEKK
jgi:putative FmdB family regulatory protein